MALLVMLPLYWLTACSGASPLTSTPVVTAEMNGEETSVPTATVAYPIEGLNLKKNSQVELKYPYLMLSIHPSKSLHSQNHWLKEKTEKHPWIQVPAEILKSEGLNENELITIYNDRGKITGRVKLAEGNHPKTIIIEEGYGLETEGNANWLTPDGISDMGNGSIYYECMVSIKPNIKNGS